MTISFPLPLPALADLLDIRSVVWRLQRYDQLSGLGTGDVLAAQLAPPRYAADVALSTMRHGDAGRVQALIEALDGPINSFYLFAPQQAFPQADPDGSLLGASAVTIHTVGSDNKSLRLQGLPAGYALSVGDFLAFDYGANPVRRAFHRVCEPAAASAGGITPLFEIRPHLRPGVVTSLSVTLKKPAAKVFIIPDSFNPGTATAPWVEGMSFQVMQRP